MIKKSILNLINIEIDENYKWYDTLYINDKYLIDYNSKVKYLIKIKYNKNIDYSKAREIEKNIFCCEEYCFDKEKGVKIYFEKENICVLEANQECNEWLIIMIQIMFLKQNLSFIHSGAVCNKDGALLLPSWGGVGKTASISTLIENNYKFLGDDFNIISEDGKVYGFPKKFVLYFYHEELFPKVFKKKKIYANDTINKMYSEIIPIVKPILRKVPNLLYYARKHNPRSIKVSPYDIFDKSKIEEKPVLISNAIWLERNKNKNNYTKIDYIDLVKKSVSVTMNELFGSDVSTILIMCGFNILNYEEIFIRMYNIYEKAFRNVKCNKLNVEKKLPVSNVPKEIMKNINK